MLIPINDSTLQFLQTLFLKVDPGRHATSSYCKIEGIF